MTQVGSCGDGELQRAPGVDIRSQHQSRDVAGDGLVLDRISRAHVEAFACIEITLGGARGSLRDRIGALQALDIRRRFERKFFFAQMGEELALSVAALFDQEFVEGAAVAADDLLDGRRQAACALVVVQGIQQVCGQLFCRIAMALVIAGRRFQSLPRHRIQA